MNKKRVGSLSIICFVFIILAIVISLFYFHREEDGKYKFSRTYYIHDKGIGDYSSSALVSFPIKGDYTNLIGQDVYYYDNNNLMKGNLVSISPQDKRFVIGDSEYNIDNFLGAPSNGYPVFGSVLDFVTDKTVYICGILIPGILCILYEIYAFIIGFKEEKNNY